MQTNQSKLEKLEAELTTLNTQHEGLRNQDEIIRAIKSDLQKATDPLDTTNNTQSSKETKNHPLPLKLKEQ